MPSYLDLGVIGIILVSALLSMMRGFSREILAIGSWAAAAAAAYYFYPLVLPYVQPYIHKEIIAQAIAAAIVFFATLIVVSLFTVRISDAILDSKIGALDRSLGFLFGAARGFLLAIVAFAIFNWLVAEKLQPMWVKTAKTRPILMDSAARIVAMLPQDAAATIDAWLKAKAGGPIDEPPDANAPPPGDAAPATPSPASSPAPTAVPARDGAANGASALDKRKLDAIINRAVPPPAPAPPAIVPKN